MGEAGTILHHDGAAWGARDSGTEMDLGAVWGASASDAFAVGAACDAVDCTAWNADPARAVVLHREGTAWTRLDTGELPPIRDAWTGTGADLFVATRAQGVLSFDGETWRPTDIPTGEALWGISGSEILVVGAQGSLFRAHGP